MLFLNFILFVGLRGASHLRESWWKSEGCNSCSDLLPARRSVNQRSDLGQLAVASGADCWTQALTHMDGEKKNACVRIYMDAVFCS